MDSVETDGAYGDEMQEWLWDLEDRYDVGAVDAQVATPLTLATDPRLATVRRYRRGPHGAGAGAGSGDGLGDRDDTGETEVVGADWDDAPARPSLSPRRRPNRTAVAASCLVVGGLGGLFLATRHGGSKHSAQPNVAIGASPAHHSVVVGPPGVSGSTPAPAGTTTPAPPAAPAGSPSPTAGAGPAPAGAGPTPAGSVLPGGTTQTAVQVASHGSTGTGGTTAQPPAATPPPQSPSAPPVAQPPPVVSPPVVTQAPKPPPSAPPASAPITAAPTLPPKSPPPATSPPVTTPFP